MRTLKITFISVVVIISSFLLFACGQSKVPPENLNLSLSEIELYIGNTSYLQYEFSPKNSKQVSVVWTSSDTNIAYVNKEGKVTAKEYGQATITAQIKDTQIKDECIVKVTDGKGYKIEVNTDYVKKNYYSGESFNPSGIRVAVYYESGKIKELSSNEFQVIAPEKLTENTSIIIEYNNLRFSFDVFVNSDIPSSLVISSQPLKTQYFIGEKFDPTGMIVSLVYKSGQTKEILDYTYDENLLWYTSKELTINYQNLKVSIPITVSAKTIINDFSLLQNAIDNATDGDSIMIREGMYNTPKPIIIPSSKNLIIYGENENVFLNGYNSSIFSIIYDGNTGNITLARLKLTLAQGENIQLILNEKNININLIDIVC